MPKLTLIIIGLAALLVVTVPLAARLLLPPILQPDLQAAPDDQTLISTIQYTPALQDVRQAVQLRLDAEWQVATITASELEQLLSTFGPNRSPTQQRAASTLRTGLDSDTTVISAAHRSGVTLQVVALKRNGLSLDEYLAEVGQQLSTEGATVHSNGIAATLRADRLPAARLDYSLTERDTNGQLTAVAGVQVATFDASAARLVIFTLTGQPGQHNELARLMSDILAGATF